MNCPSQDAKEGTEADCAKEGAHALPSPDRLVTVEGWGTIVTGNSLATNWSNII